MPPSGDAASDEHAQFRALYVEQYDQLDGLVSDVALIVEQFIDATGAMPKDAIDAATQLSIFQLDYERLARVQLDATEAWRTEDSLSGRTRRAVVDRLKRESPNLSDTAADKAVSGDPEYTTQKDKIAAALGKKEAAEMDANVALQRVLTSRGMLDALTAVNQVMAYKAINDRASRRVTSRDVLAGTAGEDIPKDALCQLVGGVITLAKGPQRAPSEADPAIM